MIEAAKTVLAAIGLIVILVGFRVENLSSTYISIGIALLIPSLYSLWKSDRTKKQNSNKEIDHNKQIKTNGQKIRINLAECEIKSNNWVEEKIIDSSRYAGLNRLTGEGQRNIQSVEINQTAVTYKFKIHGKLQERIERYEIDEKTLLMKFALQKETYAYIDKMDPSIIYIDSEFLSS